MWMTGAMGVPMIYRNQVFPSGPTEIRLRLRRVLVAHLCERVEERIVRIDQDESRAAGL